MIDLTTQDHKQWLSEELIDLKSVAEELNNLIKIMAFDR